MPDSPATYRICARNGHVGDGGATELQRLHEEPVREARSSQRLEADFGSGPLPSSMPDFGEFVRKFETVAAVEPRFGRIEFDVRSGERPRTRRGSTRTIDTPIAGPEASYHCTDRDRPLN